MVYKTATQKIWIFLFIMTLSITIISGTDYWKMWSVLPITFFLIWLSGKKNPHSLCYINAIDVMFMDDNAYKYEPIYENWRDSNAPDY